MDRDKYLGEIGERLKLARKKQNVRREEIASRIGIHPGTYGLYERGKRSPSAETIMIFCEFLSLNYTWLFSGKGPMNLADGAGINLGLLASVIREVELFIEQNSLSFNSAKKAEFISILYEDAFEKSAMDSSYIFTLDNKTIQFLNLLAERQIAK